MSFYKKKNDSSPTISLCCRRLKVWDFGLAYGVLAADTKLGSLPVRSPVWDATMWLLFLFSISKFSTVGLHRRGGREGGKEVFCIISSWFSRHHTSGRRQFVACAAGGFCSKWEFGQRKMIPVPQFWFRVVVCVGWVQGWGVGMRRSVFWDTSAGSRLILFIRCAILFPVSLKGSSAGGLHWPGFFSRRSLNVSIVIGLPLAAIVSFVRTRGRRSPTPNPKFIPMSCLVLANKWRCLVSSSRRFRHQLSRAKRTGKFSSNRENDSGPAKSKRCGCFRGMEIGKS